MSTVSQETPPTATATRTEQQQAIADAADLLDRANPADLLWRWPEDVARGYSIAIQLLRDHVDNGPLADAYEVSSAAISGYVDLRSRALRRLVYGLEYAALEAHSAPETLR